ncbi:DNA cytosine methyltransferase [Kibdelosporangium phytohabitans]|uniref:DNA (cytosine-5-)-methyltransferase n=1 Tax=Kibdelosporangium phytohabitans TaxID=860235 RepID=A0A0N9IGA5_9PSEU|nr:DNA cytosine methyltransferase [Kibdelosporangium phytohabitans]ALG15584.1 5-methylcytosine methyltransferase [Kibdelosporangium phytohabitans]MBE1465152.1 DNA (cytosine-5)-methyltransferase 1 [Kibdelosporangium phytohabitans]
MGERLSSFDICAGAGGLALGLERAGFDPVLLLDKLAVACETLRLNRPRWEVLEMDLLEFDPVDHQQVYDVDLLSAGLPRVKATATLNRSRGSDLELELLKATMGLMYGVQPRALLIENVPDLVTKDEYRPMREFVDAELTHLGYKSRWFVLNAADHGVPQNREQGILVAFKGDALDAFEEPAPEDQFVTVGDALRDSMKAKGWKQADEWAAQADKLAPTLVGGSWERGGPDLGPTGSKRAWARMGVDGATVANEVPGPDFHWDPLLGRSGMVPLTVEQAARLQGFPPDWRFAGRKTARYRQVGHASPPPVGTALGQAVRKALGHAGAA